MNVFDCHVNRYPTDGTIAYRQLLQSNDPYDPKFNISLGTTTVGTPTSVQAGEGKGVRQQADGQGKPAADKTDSGKIDARLDGHYL